MIPVDPEHPTLIHGECVETMRRLPDGCVNLIAADPPYFRVKGEAWDRQWDSAANFLEWLGVVADEWRRILAPNGSLYCFASPQMSWAVEGVIRERFSVLSQIVWAKPDPASEINPGAGIGGRTSKGSLRSVYPATERIIFAEQAADMAMGESGYEAQCETLRGFVFEPLRAYLNMELNRAGYTTGTVDAAWQEMRKSKGCMAGHWFGSTQWELPTAKNYAWLRALFGGGHLRREYEDLRREYEDLRREYEDLRREYEDLRRPFNVTASVPYTDVWTFPTVSKYPGKHPCEKPRAMMDHIIAASSRPGDLVLDSFMGSGVTGEAAIKLGRRFIGIEMGDYIHGARRRILTAIGTPEAAASMNANAPVGSQLGLL